MRNGAEPCKMSLTGIAQWQYIDS